MGNEEKLIRLLIVDEDFHKADQITSSLRATGMHVRAEFAEDGEDMGEMLKSKTFDLVLFSLDLPEFSIAEAQQLIADSGKDIGLIALAQQVDSTVIVEAINHGARDALMRSNTDHLIQVVTREASAIQLRRRAEQLELSFQESERRCQNLLTSSKDAVAYVHEGMHIYANDDYLGLFGFEDADDLLGLPLLDLIDPDHADDVKARMKSIRVVETHLATADATGDGATSESVTGTDEPTFTFRGRTLSNDPVEGDMTLSSADYEGEPCIQVLVRSGVTNARTTKASEPAAEPAAAIEIGTDPVANFLDLVKPRVDEVASATLLVVEIDDFDEIQAEHGLSEAKRIVAEIGRWFAEDLTDVLVERIADNRFGMIAFGSEASGDVLAEQLRAEVEDELFEVNGVTIRCTVTIGAVTVTPDSPLREGVDLAFKAMLAARETTGTNRVLWYKPENSQVDEDGLDEGQRRILGLVNEAIDGNRFQLLFQPTISLRGDAEEHYEVFLRLTGDDNEQLAPHQFLELAIEHGVSAKIDRWVILHSIKQLAAHRAEGHNTRLTINLTSNSLTDEEFIQWLAVAIKAARMPSDAVIFQIAEPDAASHVRQARQFVQGLAAMHCRSSMRHFGLNDSSFETLRHVPVDFVKLDGAQVREMEDSPTNREQLAAVIEQLQGMGKLTVVPMVESATVLSALWQAGANYIQGHYLQEPTAEMDYDFTTED